MKKKNTRAEIRKAAQLAEDRSELNRRIQYAATRTVRRYPHGLENNVDDTVRNAGIRRTEYGLLGFQHSCAADCCCDECGVLEYEAARG